MTSTNGLQSGPTPLVNAYPNRATRLNLNWTYGTLEVGRSNSLAIAAANQITRSAGKQYNPLFIYGGVSVGKTHLLHAIGNAFRSKRPHTAICYVHASQFVVDVVRAYHNKSFDAFRSYYHSLDLILIDDIQLLANMERTQEELFYAFEALAQGKSQIAMSCETCPTELKGFSDRLISRLGAGLTVPIAPATRKMRTAILKRLAKSKGIKLSDDVVAFVSKMLPTGVRELQGVMNRFELQERMYRRKITLSVARSILDEIHHGPA